MGMFRNLLCKGLIDAPSNYTKVDYIQNVGRGYIDTGIIASVDVAARGKIFRSFTSGDRYIIGCRYDGGNTRGLFISWSTRLGYYVGLGNYSGDISYKNIGQYITFDTNYITKKLILNGLYEKTATNTVNKVNCSYQIFFTKLATSTSKISYACESGCKCYELELYNSKNGALIRKFVPVVNNDTNEYGMWEMVKGKFYGNAWSQGSITGGFDE